MKTNLKNVVIINDFAFINCGAGKVALTSAKALSKEGYNVTLFTAMLPIDTSLERSGVNVVCLNQKDILSNSNRLQAICQGLWNKKAEDKFAELLASLDYKETIIHFHGWTKALSASLWKVTALSKFKVIVTLHDYFTFCPNGGLFDYHKLQICNKKPSSASCYLCNCDSRSYSQKIWRDVRQLLQWYWLKRNKNISFISISEINEKVSKPCLEKISKKWFRLQNPIEINRKEPIDISKNKAYLFVARLSAEKGVEMFCQAMSELNLNGIVLGDGYLKDILSKKYPQVLFTGWVTGKEKEKFIRKGKALVFPSLWYEGAPLTIVEMQSYGLPCIVPNMCAASEEVIDNETGFVFDSGNISSLKEAILKFEKCDENIMQKKILKNFCAEKYSVQRHIENLIQIYQEILSCE